MEQTELVEAAGDLSLDTLFASFLKHHPGASTDMIERAFVLAEKSHRGQNRKSGEPYITHPLIVSEMLADYGFGEHTLAAGLLHDTVEDTPVTLEQITAEFGEDVAALIDGVTKLDRLDFVSPEEHQAATIRKMVLAMARDVRVLLIKLTDRLHNVRTLDALRPEKQQRIASETLEVYAPLAHRLGVQEIKHEMEERCFAILYPKRKAELEDLVKRRSPTRDAYITGVVERITTSLEQVGIRADVTGRPKHLYSIYRKMMQSDLPFDQIYDLIGVRIITDEVKDCYAALGIVHTIWPPIHGRFKDYIAMPKFNLYQSLHTTVVGPDGKALEVQIRTEEMHERAEYGIAAHWRYKSGEAAEIPLIADIRFLHAEYPDPKEFLDNLKIDLYDEEVFALTPKGKVHSLPRGATMVDFAYRIHTEVGHHCIGAKANGRLVSLDTQVESGDIIEILTSKDPGAGPSRDWLEYVKSTRASAKIRQWFSKERREAAIHEGRDTLYKALRREGLGLTVSQRDAAIKEVAEALGFAEIDQALAAIGSGTVKADTFLHKVVRLVKPDEEATAGDLLAPPKRRTRPRRPTRGIIVEGLDDVLVRIAQCCAPVPGDDIVGFVTIGRGVSVHKADCANIGALNAQNERIIDVSWAPEYGDSFFVWIHVEALDRPRLLRDVSAAVSDLGANIHASSSGTGRDKVAILRFEIELSEAQQLDRLINAVQGVNGVFDAYRLVQGAPIED